MDYERGDRIRIRAAAGITRHGSRGAVTDPNPTQGMVGVWLDGDALERWFQVEHLEMVERPAVPFFCPTKQIFDDLRARGVA